MQLSPSMKHYVELQLGQKNQRGHCYREMCCVKLHLASEKQCLSLIPGADCAIITVKNFRGFAGYQAFAI